MMVWYGLVWYVMLWYGDGYGEVHNRSSRIPTLFPLFDCPASGRQPALFGQPSLEFQRGGIGHRVADSCCGDMVALFLAWSNFLTDLPGPIGLTDSLSTCLTSLIIDDKTQY